jgi:hypothetical protein
MPTLAELQADIEALDANERGRFNQQCDSKVYNTLYGLNESWPDVDQLASDVDALNSTDFATLQGNMAADSELSERPC